MRLQPRTLLFTALAACMCAGGGGIPFEVKFCTPARLGLQLTTDLHVRGFERSARDQKLPAEASGWVRMGDALLRVNDVDVAGYSLARCAALIAAASPCKTLTFDAAGGRNRTADMAIIPQAEEGVWGHPGTLQVRAGGLPSTSVPFMQAMFGARINCSAHKAAPLYHDPRITGCVAFRLDASHVGSILLLSRGDCTFQHKVRSAQVAGAAGVVIINVDEELERMPASVDTGGDVPITIPAVLIRRSDGDALRAAIAPLREAHRPLPAARLSLHAGADCPKWPLGSGGSGTGASAAGFDPAGGGQTGRRLSPALGNAGMGDAAAGGGMVLIFPRATPPASTAPHPLAGGQPAVTVAVAQDSATHARAYFNADGSVKTRGEYTDPALAAANWVSQEAIPLSLPDLTRSGGPAGANAVNEVALSAQRMSVALRWASMLHDRYGKPRAHGGRGSESRTRRHPQETPAPSPASTSEDEDVAQNEAAASEAWQQVLDTATLRSEYMLAKFGNAALPTSPLRLVRLPLSPHAGCVAAELNPDVRARIRGNAVIVRRGTCSFNDVWNTLVMHAGARLLLLESDTWAPLWRVELPPAERALFGKTLQQASVALLPDGFLGELQDVVAADTAMPAADVDVLLVGSQDVAAAWEELNTLRDASAWPRSHRERRKTYLSLSRFHHPDKASGAPSRFKSLVATYDAAEEYWSSADAQSAATARNTTDQGSDESAE